MTKIIFSKSFVRALNKLLSGNPDLENQIKNKLEIFRNNPFDPTLRTHKLKGKLSDYRSFSITGDLRIVFEFTEEGYALLSDIGTHDEVY